MAQSLKTNKDVDRYIKIVKVMAAHHAQHVLGMIDHLQIAVRARLQLGIDDISVYSRKENISRTCWVTMNGNRKVFVWNRKTKTIDLRDGSLQGGILYSFDHTTPRSEIVKAISEW